jgi:hypothetical protein
MAKKNDQISAQKNGRSDTHTRGVVLNFIGALGRGSDELLDSMTYYKGGSIGGSKSNIQAFRKSGPMKMVRLLCDGEIGIALFASQSAASDRPTHVGSFRVEGKRVVNDWMFGEIS